MEAEQLKFDALVNAYASDMYRYAYWVTRQPSLAEDLVQETFMRAWRGIKTLQEPKAARAWLWTILRREIARHYERQKREPSAPDNTIDDYDGLSPDETPEADGVESLDLYHALYALPADYREALLLQVIGGYSCDEIARITHCQTGAIMTRLSRARQKLRTILTAEDTSKKMVKR